MCVCEGDEQIDEKGERASERSKVSEGICECGCGWWYWWCNGVLCGDFKLPVSWCYRRDR